MAKGKGRDKRLEIRWRRIIKEHVNSGLTKLPRGYWSVITRGRGFTGLPI
jgi:hypothetical protein